MRSAIFVLVFLLLSVEKATSAADVTVFYQNINTNGERTVICLGNGEITENSVSRLPLIDLERLSRVKNFLDVDKQCIGLSGKLTGAPLLAAISSFTTWRSNHLSEARNNRLLNTIRELQAIGTKLDAQQSIVEQRQRFFEDALVAELQRRMDLWPIELLANREAYDALKEQMAKDLKEILSSP